MLTVFSILWRALRVRVRAETPVGGRLKELATHCLSHEFIRSCILWEVELEAHPDVVEGCDVYNIRVR
jgi:hypothetical protein